MRTFLFALAALTAFAQNDVVESMKPETNAYTRVIHFTGANADYICTASARQDVSTITVTTISNANPGVVTATAHGFYYSASGVVAKPLVFITGATSGWTGINGLHVITPTGVNSFTIDVDTSGFGAWGSQSIVMTTRAPLITNKVWSVKALVPDASGNTVYIASAVDTAIGTASNPSTATNKTGFACAAPTSYQ